MTELWDVIMWKNQQTTRAAVATLNLGLILVFVLGWSVLRLVSMSLLLVLGLGLVVSVTVGRDEVREIYGLNETCENSAPRIEFFSKTQLEALAGRLEKPLNDFANQFYSLVMWFDTAASAKASLCLFVMSFFFRIFPTWFLLLVGINGLFALTFFTDEDKIRRKIRSMLANGTNQYDLIVSVLPGVDKVRNKNE